MGPETNAKCPPFFLKIIKEKGVIRVLQQAKYRNKGKIRGDAGEV